MINHPSFPDPSIMTEELHLPSTTTEPPSLLPEGKPADEPGTSPDPAGTPTSTTDHLSEQISNDTRVAGDDDMSGVSVVEEGDEVGEVEVTVLEETKDEVVGELEEEIKEKVDEGVDESSDSVEVVEEAHLDLKEEAKKDVAGIDITEVVEEFEMIAEDVTADDAAPFVEPECVSKVESAPVVDDTKMGAPEDDIVPESSGKEVDSAEETSEKESASEDGLLSEELEETTEVIPEEPANKRYSLIHFICSLALVGSLFCLSFYSDSNEPDQLTIGLSTLLFAYLTTFAAADLEMIDPKIVSPWLITVFNAVVCPFLVTFLLANPAIYPAEEVGLMTPVLAWLLGIELWVQFDKLDWKKMTMGVAVALGGVAIHLNFLENGDSEIIE